MQHEWGWRRKTCRHGFKLIHVDRNIGTTLPCHQKKHAWQPPRSVRSGRLDAYLQTLKRISTAGGRRLEGHGDGGAKQYYLTQNEGYHSPFYCRIGHNENCSVGLHTLRKCVVAGIHTCSVNSCFIHGITKEKEGRRRRWRTECLVRITRLRGYFFIHYLIFRCCFTPWNQH